MLKEYTKEQNWEFFEKLPSDLKEAIFSMETADNIWNICERNGVNEVSKAAKIVGQILIGTLSPNELQETLTEELPADQETARKVTQEVGRYIFLPVKSSLQKIYSAGASSLPETPIEEVIKKPSGPDTYRETIE